MKNNKTRKLGGGGARKYKTRSIPLQFVKKDNKQETINSISFNSNSIDKFNLGEQVLDIIKQLQEELVGNTNTQDNITFSIVGKKQIRP